MAVLETDECNVSYFDGKKANILTMLDMGMGKGTVFVTGNNLKTDLKK